MIRKSLYGKFKEMNELYIKTNDQIIHKLLDIAVGEQNSWGEGQKNLPKCSK